MKRLDQAVADSIKTHPFNRVSDLNPDEFSELMTTIIKNALDSQEVQDRIAKEIKDALLALPRH